MWPVITKSMSVMGTGNSYESRCSRSVADRLQRIRVGRCHRLMLPYGPSGRCVVSASVRTASHSAASQSGLPARVPTDVAGDRIASQTGAEWNRRVLELMSAGDGQAIRELAGDVAGGARVDMGFKHFAWLAGAMGERWSHGATVHAYGRIYGSGAAVVEFGLDLAKPRSPGALDPIEFMRYLRVPHPFGAASDCANRQSCRCTPRRPGD